MTTDPSSPRRRAARAVALAPAPDGVLVTLAGAPARTPSGAPLVLPTASLADAVAHEWRAREDDGDPGLRGDRPEPSALRKMPLTRLAATALDRVVPHRAEVIAGLVAYADSELICHRAEGPDALAERQARAWEPLLDWLASTTGARLEVTAGVMPHRQSAAARHALHAVVADRDDWALTALQLAVTTSGSLVLGLALVAGRLDPEATLALAQLDELYQVERWGDDAEATARRAAQGAELALVPRCLTLLGVAPR